MLAKDLERSEREAPPVFAAFVFTGALLFTGLREGSLKSYNCPPSSMCIEKVRNLVGGSSDDCRKRFIIKIVDNKEIKFDIVFHS
jgi:hypothetical protein